MEKTHNKIVNNLTTLDCSSIARMPGKLKMRAILYPSIRARCCY